MRPAVDMPGYIGSHWRGEQSLARSFWLNLVLLRAGIFTLQRLLRPVDGDDHAEHMVVVVALIVLVHGVLFLWQVVGVVRAAEVYLIESGSQVTPWGAQLGCVVLMFLTVAFALESWQMTQPSPVEDDFHERMQQERATRYTLSLDQSEVRILLQGSIELGVTQRVEELLEATPTIDELLLDSSGGNVFEARGLARLAREHKLATHVEAQCASACTLAFIGGNPRSMSETARLGFHQYRLDDERSLVVGDPAQAQRLDQALFSAAGVSDEFVSTMFDQTSDGMLWPSPVSLQAAGVVDRVTPPAN